MPKPPKFPKSLGKKPPSTLPISRGNSKASQSQPPLQAKNRTSEEAWEQAWRIRPRLSDIKTRPEEELMSRIHKLKVGRWRQWPMFMCGLTAFGMGMYGVMLYSSLSKGPSPEDVPYDLIDRFDREAEGYDEKVGFSETLLFLTSKRKDLTKRARGHVLEVAVGTGRNIPYYKTKQCATVTLLDTSGPMLDVAKRKWKDTHPEYFHRVFFKQQSALDPIVPPYGAQDGYDTVIETMGLCSTPEPVKLLQNLGACTKEDGGQILLLEHGKSHYEWLNYLLDQTAPAHADQHGCWWNKDIGKIVEESGLEVVRIKRYNFGTTWWVELKPTKGMRNKGTKTNIEQPPVSPEYTRQVAQKSWLSLWR